MKTILLITHTSGIVISFRSKLIEDLQKNNFDVSILTLDNEYQDEIEKRNMHFYYVKDKNRSVNPFKILTLTSRLEKKIKEINPDIVFTFMLKPNTFGVMAAHKAKIKNIYSMVEGTGDPFTYNTFKWKIIRFVVSYLYKRSLKYSKKVFFLNKDDKQEFIDRKLVKESQCKQVFGIGVDLDHFNYRPIKNARTFLMIARMLETKGVYEYCKAAREVKKIYPDVTFNYIGAEGTIKLNDINEFIDDGFINYLGTTKDVRPFIEDCTYLVLPSYKEGMPVTVMEAQSMGRAVIASDTNGCRDTVINGVNGYLINKKDYLSLKDKIIYCINNSNPIELGLNARNFAEKNFNYKEINKKIIKEIEE